jgi:rod shape-determining protein MreD
MISGTLIGLLTDCLVDGTLGIYGFSRTLSAFLVNEFSKYVDLKKTIFKFFIIAVSLSLSNGVALFFLSFINSVDFNMNMIVYQPVMTAMIGIFIIYWKTFREKLNVY